MQKIFTLWNKLFPVKTVFAHCDIPCGIYDPHLAQIGALTVIRMIDLLNELEKTHTTHDIVRCIMIKEEHAELVKREIRVIWGDYFKAEHIDRYPKIHDLVHEIMQLGSKSKQTANRQTAVQLLNAVNNFAEIFWQTKNKETKRVKSPYKPEEEIVYPVL